MKKKILAGIATSLICISLVGCGNVSGKDSNNSNVSANKNKYEKLEGTWAEDYSLDEIESKFDDLLNKVDEKTRFYGLDYNVEKDIVTDDNGEVIKESYLYLDQENPEENRLESLYFSLKLYGASEEKGQISMKTSLNFNGEEALKSNKVKFEDTSLAAYAEIFTGVSDRDYSEINKKILEVLKSDSGEGTFNSSIDGLYEEFTVTKDYIVYTLESKEYNFTDNYSNK